MAKLIKVDGTVTEVLPKNGKTFTLDEMQSAVGGWIEMVFLPHGEIVVMDEEGKIKNKAANMVATERCRGIINKMDYVAGDALLCLRNEVEE